MHRFSGGGASTLRRQGLRALLRGCDCYFGTYVAIRLNVAMQMLFGSHSPQCRHAEVVCLVAIRLVGGEVARCDWLGAYVCVVVVAVGVVGLVFEWIAT